MSLPKTISVTGSGRSGTNILKQVFSQHSQIATLPFEYRFVIDPKGVIDFYQTFNTSFSPYRVDQKLKELESFLLSLANLTDKKAFATVEAKKIDSQSLKLTPPAYSGWELNQWIPGYEQFVHELMATLISFKYNAIWPGSEGGVENNLMYFSEIRHQLELIKPLSTFLNKCITSIINAQKKSFFLEDNTHNILYAQALCELIPGIKHIHIIRDPKDVISSLKSQRWAPSSIEQTTKWYKSVINEWLNQKSKLQPHEFIEIKFEDFIQNPSISIQKLCDFIEIDFETSLLNVELSKHNIGRHQRDLNKADIAFIENNLSEIIDLYKYN